MNLSCDMVMDLAPAYKDGAASEDTIREVEAHLKGCRDCRRYFRQYESIDRLISRGVKQEDAPREEEPGFEGISSALRRRRIFCAALLIASAVVALSSLVAAIVAGKRR